MKSIFHARLLLASLLFVFQTAFSQDIPAMLSAPRFQLRVMAYNVNGLPWPLKSNKAPLFTEMARVIQDQRAQGTAPHLIMVQEGFRGNVSHFVENSGYKYIQKGPNSKARKSEGDHSSAIINSGLYILSDFPIVKTDYIVFGSDCSGWDCYANKGVLYVQVDIPGVGLVDTFDTHFNSLKSSGTKDEAVWAAQLKQMQQTSAFVQSHISADRPSFFGGDFNIKANSPVYNNMLNALLPLSDVGQFCQTYTSYCKLGEGTQMDQLLITTDHQYYKSGGSFKVYPSYALKNMKTRVGDRELSDHEGLVVYYDLY